MSSDLPFRPLDPGQGEAVFRRTYQRGAETWGDVADRVSYGSMSLVSPDPESTPEYEEMRQAMRHGILAMSGRHLQQGDRQQTERPMEVFTNCSTAPWSWGKFYLLLNGSGVGRYYANDLTLVDWRQMPNLQLVIGTVPDTYTGAHLTPGALHPEAEKAWAQGFANRDEYLRDADLSVYTKHYLFHVQDSREGWAQAMEMLESMAYAGSYKNELVILDFSEVRPEGAPIGGMQDRPASGPLPLMDALRSIAVLKYLDMRPWKQAMHADHYLARTVQVGGARRAARIAVKPWTDPLEDVLDFINIKDQDSKAGGDGLWSSNNSVGVDEEFWADVQFAESVRADPLTATFTNKAWTIFEAASRAAYDHGNGEPGWLNLDKLNQDETGSEVYDDGIFAESDRYQTLPLTRTLERDILTAVQGMKYKYIVNPCGEIALRVSGGFCVIADVVPFHAETLEQAQRAFVVAARALMRVNLMESLYSREVHRTNRIGVGFTGLFEFAWKFFGVTFKDLVADYDKLVRLAEGKFDAVNGSVVSLPFWTWLQNTQHAVIQATVEYAAELGMPVPHTVLTVKPSGTISKLWGLTEGAHQSAYREYIRWTQFDLNSSMTTVMEYEAKGYPVKYAFPNAQGVQAYPNVAIVGFPTRPFIRTLGIPEERFTTASETAFEEHFKWVRLLEHFWLGDTRGNQVSYTAKFDKKHTSYEEYTRVISRWMPQVRAMSVLASSDYEETVAIFGYSPEQPITAEEYDDYMSVISQMEETLTDEDLRCLAGACPII